MEADPELVAKLVSEVLARLAAEAEGTKPKDAAPAGTPIDARPGTLSGIPFVEEVAPTDRPFSDVGTKGGVDDPSKMLRGWTGVPDSGLVLETAVGRYLTSPSALLAILAERRRAVAIISAEGIDYKGDPGQWSGTGFLVGPNLFLTNHHVLNSVQVSRGAKIEFNYEISPENLLLGNGSPPRATETFALDPGRLFLTSPTVDGLDYTFVWIDGTAQEKFGSIPMERSSFTVDEGAQAFVIHHPDGRPREVSLDDTDIIGIKTTIIHYSSDTMGGSSGAPVFDHRGRLIALHHASRRQSVDLADGGHTDVVNEGIKIAAIAIDLENRMRSGGTDAPLAETVLRAIGGSDTMSGFFGGLGREIAPGSVAPEAVVATYRGTDQDIDIGFWSIEWLATRWKDDRKLNGAARVVADLNLDAWGLADVSPDGVRTLVARIEDIYGERYQCDFSEPDAVGGTPSTAMIWKKSSLVGEAMAWPSNVAPLLRERGDGYEAERSPLFEHYPGLFRFRTAGDMPAYTFHIIPLHLKAMDEGSLRRRLASRILARAVEDLSGEAGSDVIFGGEVTAPLAPEDFRRIEQAGFIVVGAQDEGDGAITYIKSPDSAVDNVFLSPGMQPNAGSADYFIVARNRSMSKFIDNISDRRPIALRLSLSRTGRTAPPETGDIDALIDRMLASEKTTSTRKRTARRRTT